MVDEMWVDKAGLQGEGGGAGHWITAAVSACVPYLLRLTLPRLPYGVWAAWARRVPRGRGGTGGAERGAVLPA